MSTKQRREQHQANPICISQSPPTFLGFATITDLMPDNANTPLVLERGDALGRHFTCGGVSYQQRSQMRFLLKALIGIRVIYYFDGFNAGGGVVNPRFKTVVRGDRYKDKALKRAIKKLEMSEVAA